MSYTVPNAPHTIITMVNIMFNKVKPALLLTGKQIAYFRRRRNLAGQMPANNWQNATQFGEQAYLELCNWHFKRKKQHSSTWLEISMDNSEASSTNRTVILVRIADVGGMQWELAGAGAQPLLVCVPDEVDKYMI